MFTIKRTLIKSESGTRLKCDKYEYQTISEVMKAFENFKYEDEIRYKILMNKHPDLFFDNSCSDFQYHYAVGACEIHCEIEGLYENASKIFHIPLQLSILQRGNQNED